MSASDATKTGNVNPFGLPTPELPNEGYRLWFSLVIMIVASSLCVAGRIATRISTEKLGSDDFTILAALASCLVQSVFWLESVRTGYGADYTKLDEWHRKEFNKWWFLGDIFYIVTLTLAKSGVILLSKRIFIQRWFQIVCWAMLVVNGCWGLGNALGNLFECLPIPSMWGAVDADVCFDMRGLWISIVTWDVLSDVVMIGLAMPMVWRLNLRMRDKIGLTGIFMLGAMVIVFSILSCSAITEAFQREDSEANQLTFALANLFQVLESNFSIICACLPVLRFPFKQLLPRLFSNTRLGRASAPYYYDDSFRDQYVLQNMSDKQKDRSDISWRDVSVSGPEIFKSVPRMSDELGIIRETADSAGRETASRKAKQIVSSQNQNAIKKDVVFSVDRK